MHLVVPLYVDITYDFSRLMLFGWNIQAKHDFLLKPFSFIYVLFSVLSSWLLSERWMDRVDQGDDTEASWYGYNLYQD